MDKSGYKNPEARTYTYDYLKAIGVNVLVGDITKQLFMKELEKQRFDYIVNCAAQPTMTLSISDPITDMETNIGGAVNVLELGRKLDVPVILCSSVHVYGNQLNQNLVEGETRLISTPETIDETAPILTGDITPLHASKRAMELYGLCYNSTYGLKVGILRLTGMYGPMQLAGSHHGWVSNYIIRTLLQLPIPISGTDKQVRDILYATDVALVFQKFYEHPVSGIYNIGGGKTTAVSIKEVLNIVHKITGIKQTINIVPFRHGDLQYFVCDISKAKVNLGWEPTILPEQGLQLTVSWIQNHLNLFKGIT
jgi:CDP-paratose 2-epimerase